MPFKEKYAMKNRRISDWTIRNSISDTDEIWLHGYTGAVDILEKSIIDQPPQDIQQQMLDRGYLTEMTQAEEQLHFESLCEDIRKVNLNSMLYVLQFSLECNFSCGYCFEHISRKIPKMRDAQIREKQLEKVRDVIVELRKERSIEDEELIFFGGEPILPKNKPILESVVTLSQELNIQNIKVVTNGFYIESMIELFEPNNTKFQITLDGTREVHDKRRFDKDTKKSFEKIVSNVELLVKKGFVVELRINIDHKNYKNIPSLFEVFKNRGLSKYQNFQPYLAYIQDYGKYKQRITPSEISVYFESQSIFEDFEIGLDPLGLQRMLYKSVVDGEPFAFTVNHCGANKGTMITFSPDGLIHPCWDSNTNDTPIGTYYPAVTWNTEFYKDNWIERDITKIPECNKCKYALFCGGGCQYLSNLKDGGYYKPHCSGFPSAFDMAIMSIGRSML